jgi:hypothetical protein
MKLHQQFSDLVHLVLDLFNLRKEVQQVATAPAQQQNNKKTRKQQHHDNSHRQTNKQR